MVLVKFGDDGLLVFCWLIIDLIKVNLKYMVVELR